MGLRRLFRSLFRLNRWRPEVARLDNHAALKLDYLSFKELIASNDEILEIIADLERKLEGDQPFGMNYIRSRCVTAATHAYRMIADINKLSRRRYQELYLIFSALKKRMEAALPHGTGERAAAGPAVYPMAEIDASSAARVGGKSANLGELRNRAGLPVPEAFAVSVDAFHAFMEENRLPEEIRALQIDADPADPEGLDRISSAVKRAVMRGALPDGVLSSLQEGHRALADALGFSPRLSVRSSAVGEDSEISFAGQYVSRLNVSRDRLDEAYKEVVAGLYTPRAIYYRLLHGVPDEEVPMGALCMAMVDAAASGVACSVNPARPGAGTLIVNASWGLGVGTVEGSVSPDFWEIAKNGDMPVVHSRLGSKEWSVETLGSGGVGPSALPEGLRGSFCLTEGQVRELSYLVLLAEKHFGRPQEIEWALDRLGRFYLLQARPLPSQPSGEATEAPPPLQIDGMPLLLRGAPASGGCGAGPVFPLAVKEDPSFFPEGAVLVVRHSSPSFVKVMGRAAAVISDVGASTGHMASLAREFRVPAVLDTGAATTRLKPGQVVTVDGDRGAVYDGRAPSLLARAAVRERTMKGTPVYRILQEVSDCVSPLNLTDPSGPDFQPGCCRTFHDIARFVHEKSFEEMFRMSDQASGPDRRAFLLNERLPFEVHLIDLGGGLDSGGEGGRAVGASQVKSRPMQALLKGMVNPQLQWWKPRGISMAGFLSVATESLFNPVHVHGERRLGDRSYGILAESYCNFSSRIGYHFTAVDAYCSDSLSRNHISFRFKGGAADDLRRARRCELIEEILRRLDFQVDRQGDLVNARLRKFDRTATADRLDQLGRLIVATRQLDMRMGPASSVAWYADAFFESNYLFDPGFVPADGG